MSLLALLEFKLDVYINTALCTVYVCVRACTHAHVYMCMCKEEGSIYLNVLNSLTS